VGIEENLSGNVSNISRPLTAGQQYYIRARADAGGTYRIGFNTTFAPPGTTGLTENTWANGTGTANGAQWYRFTATAATQFVHIESGSFLVQLFDNNGTPAGTEASLSGSTRYFSRPLAVGQEYLARVRNGGSFRIAFNAIFLQPGTTVTELPANTWTNGSVTGEGWFGFTATAVTQHFFFQVLSDQGSNYNSDCRVQLFEQNGNTSGTQFSLSSGRPVDQITRTLIVGQRYYLRVQSTRAVNFRIAFNGTGIEPGVAVTLTENTVANGNIATVNAVNWFRFTATAETQWIHFAWGTRNNVLVQLYGGDGTALGTETSLSAGGFFTSRSVTVGGEYYIRVRASGGTGTYGITFNRSVLAPGIPVTPLTANSWADIADMSYTDRGRWFSFTATAATHYIHFTFGTMTNGVIVVYDGDSKSVTLGNIVQSGAGTAYWPVSQLAVGRQYHIYVVNGNNFNVTNLRIAFNTSATPPK